MIDGISYYIIAIVFLVSILSLIFDREVKITKETKPTETANIQPTMTEKDSFEMKIDRLLNSNDAFIVEKINRHKSEVIAGSDVYIVYQVNGEIKYIERKVTGEKVFPLK